MKPALRSANRTNAFINKNFILQVSEYAGKEMKLDPEKGKIILVDVYKKPKITSANRIIKYLKDEKLKIKLFKQLLESTAQQHTVLIRKRLKIKIWSK